MNSAIFGPSYSVTTLSMAGLVTIECLKTSVAYVLKIKIGYTLDLRIVVNNISVLSDKDLGLLLKKKDKMGKTPLDEAFYSMPKHETFEVLRIPSGCEIKDVFYTFCRAKHDLILTEYSDHLCQQRQ
jgi:hypothetical protein